ncbi:ArgR family transcriptional regulator [Lacticaseibacillus pabuli]|uniref:Arginine repressor n=1 Tax=Lacticaseibacillus pabuli TaxID=3025672 RepID=A0ABY7WU31_9LACO|nr:ArgR family transcriptional regulator [Lacticaseibacillus sp. KACC 23028]WDF83672.1 ArgR family transcriptional regulator [Lacticaseibacillus sp. KACC 23028]
MPKQTRQEIIKNLLNSNIVETQEQLVELLRDTGVDVTQATVSRDIKDMQLIKVPIRDGRYRYSLPVDNPATSAGSLDSVLSDALQSVGRQDYFVNLILSPGSGPAVASILQARADDRIFAIVPADASILLICRGSEEAIALTSELGILLEK